MKYSEFQKGLTVLIFLLLIITFIVYRVGFLDGIFSKGKPVPQISHNDGVAAINNSDTIIPKKDSTRQKTKKEMELMSSSKSIVLPKPSNDTHLGKPLVKINVDILLKDTTKTKKSREQ